MTNASILALDFRNLDTIWGNSVQEGTIHNNRKHTDPPDMQKKKKIYWLTTPVTDHVRALENQLKHSGFHCDFFSSLDALMSAVAARRTTIVVIGDLGSLEKENAALRYLAQRPELQGVRFILTPLHMRPGTMGLAAAFNFRDIVPMDLPPVIWAERFIFATSLKVKLDKLWLLDFVIEIDDLVKLVKSLRTFILLNPLCSGFIIGIAVGPIFILPLVLNVKWTPKKGLTGCGTGYTKV